MRIGFNVFNLVWINEYFLALRTQQCHPYQKEPLN